MEVVGISSMSTSKSFCHTEHCQVFHSNTSRKMLLLVMTSRYDERMSGHGDAGYLGKKT